MTMRRRQHRRLRPVLTCLTLVVLAATLLPTGPRPTRAAGPDHGALAAAPADRRPTALDGGRVDVGRRLHRADGSTATADPLTLGKLEEAPTTLADTSGQPPIATTTTAPDDQAGIPFQGLDSGDVGAPPVDPWVAVGPEDVIQVIDPMILVQDRADSFPLIADLASADLFDLPEGWGSAAPRVLYDSARSRWILSQTSWTCDGDDDGTSDDPVGSVDLLVSSTADPLDPWDLWWVQWDGYLPMEPAVGTSTDKLGIGIDLFAMEATSTCVDDPTRVGTDVTVIDWAAILDTGASDLPLESFGFGLGGQELEFRSPRVAVQTPAASPVLHVVVERLHADTTTIEYGKLGGTVAGGVSVGWAGDLNEEGLLLYSVAPPAPKQPGGTTVVDDLDSRPTQAIWMDGRLTWVATVGCVPNPDRRVRRGLRLRNGSVGRW